MKTVLFVCTGNVFRSMTAEYAFRAQVGDTPFRAESAGVGATVQEMYGPVKDRLVEMGIDPSGHVQRKLTREMLDAVDLPVAMGVDHQVFIREHFERDVVLFNRVALDTDEPIPDIWEVVPDWENNEAGRRTYAVQVVDTIWKAMPGFIRNLAEYMT
jgi:protein-tyrosine phosphatase